MAVARILVVEDERIIATHIRRQLTRMGYTVLATASSGPEAIEKAQAYSPDVVLMDIKLEGAMDGVEAGEYIQAHWHIPIVYMTAYALVERTQRTEPFFQLSKPFDEDSVQSMIELALGRQQPGRACAMPDAPGKG